VAASQIVVFVSETKTYHVVVKLEFQFDRLLPYNETFKEQFRQQVSLIFVANLKMAT
jgi:hypothetical protein